MKESAKVEIQTSHGTVELQFSNLQEAMERIISFAFKDLELERLWARFHTGNEPSRRLLEKLGFTHEGTLRGHVWRDGARRDCALYGRMKN